MENILGSAAYQNNKVNQWTSSIVEGCLKELTKLSKPYKYIGEGLNVVQYLCGCGFSYCAQHSCHRFSSRVVVFVVTSVIMQKNGAGLHTASSCYWDNTTDGKL